MYANDKEGGGTYISPHRPIWRIQYLILALLEINRSHVHRIPWVLLLQRHAGDYSGMHDDCFAHVGELAHAEDDGERLEPVDLVGTEELGEVLLAYGFCFAFLALAFILLL